jgi:hypothetical protein
MKAKDKAKELVERFLALKKINPNAITRPYNWQEAKQCALICVDEIVKNTLQVPQVLDYWNEVKQYLLLEHVLM